MQLRPIKISGQMQAFAVLDCDGTVVGTVSKSGPGAMWMAYIGCCVVGRAERRGDAIAQVWP